MVELASYGRVYVPNAAGCGPTSTAHGQTASSSRMLPIQSNDCGDVNLATSDQLHCMARIATCNEPFLEGVLVPHSNFADIPLRHFAATHAGDDLPL